MIPTKVQNFARLLSLEKILDLRASGYNSLLTNKANYESRIRTGTKYYVISVSGSTLYNVDKETLYVYDFYKRFVGTLDVNIQRTTQTIQSYPQKYKMGNPSSSVTIVSRKKIVAPKGYVGKVFHASWGYDQTNNEFVKVIKETPKRVTVVKLKTNKTNSGFMSGSESPILNSKVGKPFTLSKSGSPSDRELSLRGSDKSERDSDYVLFWREWKGGSVAYSSYA
jgi:hypothetical protein